MTTCRNYSISIPIRPAGSEHPASNYTINPFHNYSHAKSMYGEIYINTNLGFLLAFFLSLKRCDTNRYCRRWVSEGTVFPSHSLRGYR